jgi:hypothetical protein
MASMAALGVRLAGIVGALSIIVSTRDEAFWTRLLMAAASGMLRQYFCGMCWRISLGLSRAGLKVLS